MVSTPPIRPGPIRGDGMSAMAYPVPRGVQVRNLHVTYDADSVGELRDWLANPINTPKHLPMAYGINIVGFRRYKMIPDS